MDDSILDVSVAPHLSRVLALGVIVLDEVVLPADSAGSDAAVHEAAEEARRRLATNEAREEHRALARRIYRAFGIDPTKHRPSSEQLAHRILRGDPFPRVNPLVDAVNVCQLRFGVPYGLYDRDAVKPPVVARTGVPGESYAGIRKGSISVEGRPCVADELGPFGNPSADSDRAKTSPATRRAIVLIFGAADLPSDEWRRLLAGTVTELRRHVSFVAVEERVVRGRDASPS